MGFVHMATVSIKSSKLVPDNDSLVEQLSDGSKFNSATISDDVTEIIEGEVVDDTVSISLYICKSLAPRRGLIFVVSYPILLDFSETKSSLVKACSTQISPWGGAKMSLNEEQSSHCGINGMVKFTLFWPETLPSGPKKKAFFVLWIHDLHFKGQEVVGMLYMYD